MTTGKTDPNEFIASGLRSLQDLERALAGQDRVLESFEHVLDFGVGVGRVARHMEHVQRLVGVDVMPEMVSWCSDNLPFGTYLCNDPLPPLPFENGEFDLVVNHSVFTHLDEVHQDVWLMEISRVLSAGGLAVLSFSGEVPFLGYIESLHSGGASDRAAAHADLFAEQGFIFIEDDNWVDTDFPDWYHSMFHDPSYVLKHWSQFLPVVSWIKNGNLNFQDTVVLQKEG